MKKNNTYIFATAKAVIKNKLVDVRIIKDDNKVPQFCLKDICSQLKISIKKAIGIIQNPKLVNYFIIQPHSTKREPFTSRRGLNALRAVFGNQLILKGL